MNKITYNIQGLCSSHSAVLRSMILLTENSVECTWQPVLNDSAQVLFLGEQADADLAYARRGQILISLGNCAQKQSLHLELPLLFPRVAKLLASATQAALNEQALRQDASAQLLPSAWGGLDYAPLNPGTPPPAPSGQLYKLKTWPPAGVIGSNRAYMRAAAVLTGKSLTSSQLAEKTNLPLDDCRQFISKLSDSQCLNISPAGSTPEAPGLAPSASSAGLSPRPPSAPNLSPSLPAAMQQQSTSSSANNSGLGLFGRIRSRLGFLGKASA